VWNLKKLGFQRLPYIDMCLNHVGGWFSKTQRDKKFDPGYWIKFLEPPWCHHKYISLWKFDRQFWLICWLIWTSPLFFAYISHIQLLVHAGIECLSKRNSPPILNTSNPSNRCIVLTFLLVMCGPGSAWKPWLGLGFWELGLEPKLWALSELRLVGIKVWDIILQSNFQKQIIFYS